MGTAIAPLAIMEFICQHCETLSIGNKYRVISEEDGVTFLNMVVCRSCRDQARGLGLRTDRLDCDSQHRDDRMHHSGSIAAHM